MKSGIAILMTACTFLVSVPPARAFQATFTPRISVNEEYTDNIFHTNDNKKDDFITVVSPGFTVDVSARDKGLALSYNPSYSVYSRHPENDTLRHNVQLTGWTDLSKITKLEFYDTFNKTEEPSAKTEAISAEQDFTRRTGRQPYYTNDVGLNLTHQIGKSDSLNLGYVYSILKNEDPTVEDNSRHNPSIGFSHRFSPYLDMSTKVDYTRGEFDTSDNFDQWKGSIKLTNKFTKYLGGYIQYEHTLMDFKGQSENYQVYDPSIGINYTIAEDTSLSLGIGYFIQDREKSKDESNLSLDGNLGMTWQLKRGSIKLNASSGYDQSYFGAENLGFNKFVGVQGAGNYGLTKSLTGNITASYRENDYINQASDRKDKIDSLSLGLTYKPLTIKWLSIGLEYSYSNHNSTLDINDYDEDRVQFNISISPSQPIRLNK